MLSASSSSHAFGVNTSKRPCACGYFGCGGGWWGGVGRDVNVHCDCNHTVRSLALPHIRHATLLHVLLHFHTYVMLRTTSARKAPKIAKLCPQPR